jgi:lipopolysaccharide transport system permease protein
MPLSIVASNLVRFGVQMLLLFMMMGYYAAHNAAFTITPSILLFPVLVILMALLGLGLGLIITALTTKYRDLAFLVTFGIQLLMYTTTVIYPLSSAPEKYKTLISLNPMTGIIEAFRYAFLGQGQISINTLGYSTLFTIIVMVLGVLIFNKTEKTFVDTV